MAQFKRGVPCPRRPKTVTTPEIIDQTHELILEDRRISTKSVAEQLGISRERVGSIIHEDLDMRKLSAKWVPKCLNADQKLQLCQSSEQRLEFFRPDPNDFLSSTIGDHGRNLVISLWPGVKQRSMEWWHSGSPHPTKFRVQKSAGKFLASIFWDKDGFLFIDYIPKGPTINAEYYWSLLVQLNDNLEEKRRGNFTNGVLFLHDNAPAHRALVTQKKLAYLGFQCLDHPPYSPDLAPLDYHLFPGLKNNWKFAIFWPTRMSLLPQRPGWTDNIMKYFFDWLAKARSTG